MGVRGPVPKRSSERIRRNIEGRPDVVNIEAPPSAMPAPESGWNPEAREWYLSLAASGQSRFYEPSDWRQAHVLATILSRLLSGAVDPRHEAAMFKTWLAGASELGATESSRRRMRVEVARQSSSDSDEYELTIVEGYGD